MRMVVKDDVAWGFRVPMLAVPHDQQQIMNGITIGLM